jgi:hypothetical protein
VGKFGIADIGQVEMFFGPRWAYHLQDQILGERLAGLVFPSRTAAGRCFAQAVPMLLARHRAWEIQEQSHATQTRILTDREFDDSPEWAGPEWFGEKLKLVLLNRLSGLLWLFARWVETKSNPNHGRRN